MKYTFLVAILDWGLGHATRMIPLIAELRNQGARVIVASSGNALALIRQEFKDIEVEELPAYGVQYSDKAYTLPWVITRQLPRLLRTVKEEERIARKLAEEHEVCAVISDNRYGVRSPDVKNIIITHQLFVRAPLWLKPAQWISRFVVRQMIRRFDECWVPDFEGKVNLSGDLSHHKKLPPGTRFIGPLSRFTLIGDDPEESYLSRDLLIILSGPEPQRTHLETLLTYQVRDSGLNTVLVRGSGKLPRPEESQNMLVIDLADSNTLFDLMKESRTVICRSGYSSIMDLAATGRDAILIPTPGQTEQEYLASRFRREGVFYSEKQANFNLIRALERAQEYSGLKIQMNEKRLSKVVADLIMRIRV